MIKEGTRLRSLRDTDFRSVGDIGVVLWLRERDGKPFIRWPEGETFSGRNSYEVITNRREGEEIAP